MPRYIVQRAFPGAGGRGIVAQRDDEVTWLHSYVSEDGQRSFCLYEAPSPEAIRRSSARDDLPVESITAVCVLDPYQYTQP